MILVLVEHDAEGPSRPSLQALTLGRDLAGRLGLPVHAALIGEEGRAHAADLGTYGASAAHVLAHPDLGAYAPAAWGAALAGLVADASPAAVLAAGTDRGNEVMAHLAARAGLPMAAGCTEVEPADPWRVTRTRWGGSLLEDAELTGTGPKLLTVAPHAVRGEAAASPSEVEVLAHAPSIDPADLRVRVTDRVRSHGGAVTLAEARVVVGGGRGVGSAEGFRDLEALADLLGGAVGVSRAVTSLGWRPHAEQVGQTGTRIAPDLYIACGISGAIQHMVGCKSAKRVLAINTDPEAPILTKADFAVIGDLRAIVPAVVEELRRAGS